MATVRIGSGLAGFPGFPILPLGALTDPASIPPAVLGQIEQTFAALNFKFTATTFTFQIDSAIFGTPGAFAYDFQFTGNFAAMASLQSQSPLALFSAFIPNYANAFQVQFLTAQTTNLQTGQLTIGASVDSLGPPLSFLSFFSTLLNPANYTHDLLSAFTAGDIAQFTTLDLSGFAHGVIDARPNGPTVAVDGTISAPGGSFVAAHFGLVSFAGEVQPLNFSTVYGSASNDILATGTGNVTIYSGAGNDILVGGAGTDTLVAGNGHDLLLAGSGKNTLVAGAGPGTLIAGSGTDTLTGGGGADLFVIQRSVGATTVITDFSAAKGDRLEIVGGAAGGDDADIRFGHDTNGNLTLALGEHGSQTVVLVGLTSAAQARPGFLYPDDKGLTFGNIRIAGLTGGTVRADDKGDVLIAQGGRATLIGGKGDDVLLGGSDSSTLIAGTGDDVLDGGTGNATLIAGSGHDVMTGGTGHATFVFNKINANYGRITDFQGGKDKIDISEIFEQAKMTNANFADYVKLVPLGPTELTGFLEVSPTGKSADFRILAQVDGAAFSLASGTSASTLTANDFILGSHH